MSLQTYVSYSISDSESSCVSLAAFLTLRLVVPGWKDECGAQFWFYDVVAYSTACQVLLNHSKSNACLAPGGITAEVRQGRAEVQVEATHLVFGLAFFDGVLRDEARFLVRLRCQLRRGVSQVGLQGLLLLLQPSHLGLQSIPTAAQQQQS